MHKHIDKRIVTHLRLNHLTFLHIVGRVQDQLFNKMLKCAVNNK